MTADLRGQPSTGALGVVPASRTGRRRCVQLAVDIPDLPGGLSAVRRVATYVDVIEAGALLILGEGSSALRILRAAYPEHVLTADIRIVEAGALLSRLAFDAGADRVTVASGASPRTFGAVAAVAAEYKAQIEVELSAGWTTALLHHCLEVGIDRFIVHRSRDAEGDGDQSWRAADMEAIAAIGAVGGRVSIAGALHASMLSAFAQLPVETFIVGRAVYAAAAPESAAKDFAARVSALPELTAVRSIRTGQDRTRGGE